MIIGWLMANGKTPLHIAAENGQVSVCQLIFSKIEDKNPKATYGMTPFHIAPENGQVSVCHLKIYHQVSYKRPIDIYSLAYFLIFFTLSSVNLLCTNLPLFYFSLLRNEMRIKVFNLIMFFVITGNGDK